MAQGRKYQRLKGKTETVPHATEFLIAKPRAIKHTIADTKIGEKFIPIWG
jgi:hypothetical protein